MDGVIALIALALCVILGMAGAEQYVKGWLVRGYILGTVAFLSFCVFFFIVLL